MAQLEALTSQLAAILPRMRIRWIPPLFSHHHQHHRRRRRRRPPPPPPHHHYLHHHHHHHRRRRDHHHQFLTPAIWRRWVRMNDFHCPRSVVKSIAPLNWFDILSYIVYRYISVSNNSDKVKWTFFFASYPSRLCIHSGWHTISLKSGQQHIILISINQLPKMWLHTFITQSLKHKIDAIELDACQGRDICPFWPKMTLMPRHQRARFVRSGYRRGADREACRHYNWCACVNIDCRSCEWRMNRPKSSKLIQCNNSYAAHSC